MENCIRNARSKKESLRKVYCWKGRTESKAETRLKGRGQSFGSARIWSTILPPASRLICKDRDSGGWGLGRGFPGLRLGNFAVDFAKWRGGWGVAPRGNRKHRSMYARTSTTKSTVDCVVVDQNGPRCISSFFNDLFRAKQPRERLRPSTFCRFARVPVDRYAGSISTFVYFEILLELVQS